MQPVVGEVLVKLCVDSNDSNGILDAALLNNRDAKARVSISFFSFLDDLVATHGRQLPLTSLLEQLSKGGANDRFFGVLRQCVFRLGKLVEVSIIRGGGDVTFTPQDDTDMETNQLPALYWQATSDVCASLPVSHLSGGLDKSRVQRLGLCNGAFALPSNTA